MYFLGDIVAICTKCDLHRTCKSVCIPGFGPSDSPTLLLVGRDPGEDEDLIGRPFVGKSGKDLKAVLEAVGFDLSRCRFTNVVRCHTIKNAGPSKDQVETCFPYLISEIQACKPQAIVCLGKEASQAVLGTSEKMSSLRGRPYEEKFGDQVYPVFVTHHPSRLYRQNSLIPEFASDLQMTYDFLAGELLQGSDLVVEVLEHLEDIDSVIGHLEASGEPFTWDLETVNTYPYLRDSRILCCGFCFDKDFAYTIPVTYGLEGDATPFGDEQVALWEQAVLPRLKRLLELPNAKCGHNGPFDYLWMKVQYGIEVRELKDDTIFLHYLLDERVGTHGLKDLAVRVGMSGYDSPMRPYYNAPYNLAPWEILSRYNGLDCIATYRLWKELKPLVYDQNNLRSVYEEILVPSIEKVTWVTENGAAISGPEVESAAADLEEKLVDLTAQVASVSGETPFSQMYRTHLESKREKAVALLRKKQKPAYEAWCTEGNDPLKFRWKKPTKIKDEDVMFAASSPSKLAFMLYTVLKLPVTKRTKITKSPSTEGDVLLSLALRHPLPQLIVDHRSIAKELSTYVSMLREFTVDGIIHPGFSLFRAVTGRTTSSDPPLQNFPVKTPLRKSFVSRFGEGGILTEIDQSQMELRVMASLSGDPSLMSAYLGDPATGQGPTDVHTLTASKIFKVPLFDTKVQEAADVLQQNRVDQETYIRAMQEWWGKEEKGKGPAVIPGVSRAFLSKYYLDKSYNLYRMGVSPDQRSKGKTTNFAIIYLVGAKGLSDQLKCREFDAEAIIKSYFEGYPLVGEYIETVKKRIRREKQLTSMFGRIRRLPEIDSSEPEIVAETERQGVNFTIQSPASDITVLAYYKLHAWLRDNHMRSVVWNLVHDSINLDNPLEEWVRVAQATIRFLEAPVPWMRVPLLAEATIGQNWAQCKDDANKVTHLLAQEPKFTLNASAFSV